MQVPPVWVMWLHEHLGVTHEWCTSWYAMARVQGVYSRVVGDLPASLWWVVRSSEHGTTKLGKTVMVRVHMEW